MGFDERRERQNARCCIAPRISDDTRVCDVTPVQLREPIRPLRFGIRMRRPVPCLIHRRIVEAIVRAKVDNAYGKSCRRLNNLHRMTVRQCDEQYIAVCGDLPDAFDRLQFILINIHQMWIAF